MHLRDYIEHLKGKPEHVRRSIAFGTSAGITLVVALMWGVTFFSSDVLTLKDTPSDTGFAKSQQELTDGFQGVAGAAAAFSRDEDNGSITVVETHASSTLDGEDTGEATVIPF